MVFKGWLHIIGDFVLLCLHLNAYAIHLNKMYVFPIYFFFIHLLLTVKYLKINFLQCIAQSIFHYFKSANLEILFKNISRKNVLQWISRTQALTVTGEQSFRIFLLFSLFVYLRREKKIMKNQLLLYLNKIKHNNFFF